MSDFQEEQNALIPNEIDDDDAVSMTLSSIGRGDAELDNLDVGSDSGGGGLLSNTTLIIVVVAVVAAGSLYLMRATQTSLTGGQEVSDIETKIATTLARLNSPTLLEEGDPLKAENLSALLTPTEDVTAIFEHDVRDQQVPIEQVKKDPFSLAMGDNTLEATQVNNAAEQLDKQLEKYRNEVGRLDLQSIMVGSKNIAVIGGEFYKQGDHVGSFRITGIDKFTVYLEASGAPFELKLDQAGR